MLSVLTDMSEASLVNAIRGNLCEYFRFLARSRPPEEMLETGHFVRWYTPIQHPWFNGMLLSAAPAQDDIDLIRESIEFFDQQNINTFACWLYPSVNRSDWEGILFDMGFGLDRDTPGMALDLNSLPESGTTSNGLEIRVAEDETAMQTWAHVFTLGYGVPPAWENLILEAMIKMGLDLPVRNYLGYLDGEPVSVSTVFYSEGVAGIYSVVTLPEARGRGLGTALTLAPLLEARQAGYRVGILQSSEMGFNVYKKMGFQHLCQIENFYYRR